MLGCARQTLVRSRMFLWIFLVIVVSLANVSVLRGQAPFVEDRPAPFAGKAPTRIEIEKRDALKQYGLGLLLERRG